MSRARIDRHLRMTDVIAAAPRASHTRCRSRCSVDLQTGIVYGPAVTRRFGRALGVNLAPAARKACNFACAYCSSEWSAPPARGEWPTTENVATAVEHALANGAAIDTILVAGNGEPTLHPGFAPIAERLAQLKVRLAPAAALTLLSNGSTLNQLHVAYSLGHFDVRCIKLDAGDATTFRVMNGPAAAFGRILSDLRRVAGLSLISTFVRGAGVDAGNTTPGALDAWLDAVHRVRPQMVDLCTPDRSLRAPFARVPAAVLEELANRVRGLGIQARVFA